MTSYLLISLFSRWKDGVNQLMGKVWDWNNMYGTNLKKFDGSVLAANEDGGRCEDDVTALREDHGDDPKDGSSGPESSADIDDWQDGHRVVQFLAISANFPICAINGYDGEHGRCIYAHSEGEVQEVYARIDCLDNCPTLEGWSYSLRVHGPNGPDTHTFQQYILAPYIISIIALCFSHTDMYCNKLKPFTFMLSRAGWNGRFGAHWTL